MVTRAGAQHAPRFEIMGQAIAALTHVNPVPRDSALTELRLVQPMLMLRGSAARDRLIFSAVANFEGLTMPDGELTPGAWGEGFMDRRHPHTYAHELMVQLREPVGRVRLGIAIGKGFAPFGTDDPMSRPALRYPVNHHISQILERAVVMGSAAVDRFGLEFGIFNGDEPERPSQWPNMDRFGDSWAVRATVLPTNGLEVQVSRAKVFSPEHRPGGASDNWKWSASLRWDRAPLYGLIEWARASEFDGVFVFRTLLAEGAATVGPQRLYLRIENTDRPEEVRLLDPFRSQRPHLDNSILGISRWTIATVGYSLDGPHWKRLAARPLAEVSFAHVRDITGGVFDPADFYGSARVWSLTVGLRIDAGMSGHRMGRYGVLESASPNSPSHLH